MVAHRIRRFLLGAVCAALGAGPALAQTGVLGLVLDETRVREGTLAADVVVRTTAARPLSAGSFAIQLRNKDGLPGGAYTALTGVDVLSGAGDAVANATFDPVSQRTEVSFSSASGTVNSTFGPMVVLHYQLEPTLVEDRRFILRLDSDSIALTATDGQPVFYFKEKGRVRIDRSDADVDIEAEGGHAVPGATVVFGAKTEILGEVVSGTVACLLALVTHGPVSALIMLAITIAVVQIEGHFLQPILLGRAVSLHPLAVLIGLAVGATVGGIIGALLVIPVLAFSVAFLRGLDPDRFATQPDSPD